MKSFSTKAQNGRRPNLKIPVFHVYRDICTPNILVREQQVGNLHDRYAVSIVEDDAADHLQTEVYCLFSLYDKGAESTSHLQYWTATLLLLLCLQNTRQIKFRRTKFHKSILFAKSVKMMVKILQRRISYIP
jgi:hypothetical protein